MASPTTVATTAAVTTAAVTTAAATTAAATTAAAATMATAAAPAPSPSSMTMMINMAAAPEPEPTNNAFLSLLPILLAALALPLLGSLLGFGGEDDVEKAYLVQKTYGGKHGGWNPSHSYMRGNMGRKGWW